jgi:hypothetical protein
LIVRGVTAVIEAVGATTTAAVAAFFFVLGFPATANAPTLEGRPGGEVAPEPRVPPLPIDDGRRRPDDERITFFRGTSFFQATEIVLAQSFDAERIARDQNARGAATRGVFLSTQLTTAEAFGEFAFGDGRRSGQAVVSVSVGRREFLAFAARNGISVETPVDRIPGATETVLPFDSLREFQALRPQFQFVK